MMPFDIYDLYLLFIGISFFGVFHLLFKSEMDIYYKIVLAPIIIISFLIIFLIGVNIINPNRKPFFVIKNLSKDTIMLNFYKSKENLQYLKYDLLSQYPKKLNDSNIKSIYTNTNLRKFIQDSVPIALLLNEYDYFLISNPQLHVDSLLFISTWNSISDSNLAKPSNLYYLNDSKQIQLLKSNIVSIYLPPFSTFVKRKYRQFNNPVPIEESLPIAQLIDIKKRDKLLYRISKNNFKYIMKKEEVMNEEDSYVLEIK